VVVAEEDRVGDVGVGSGEDDKVACQLVVANGVKMIAMVAMVRLAYHGRDDGMVGASG
nr:hypothetical protein [Tanacetum cinerariifolium]